MKLTRKECLDKWRGVVISAPSGGDRPNTGFKRNRRKNGTGCCLEIKKTGQIINFPESREILAALVAKAGGELEI